MYIYGSLCNLNVSKLSNFLGDVLGLDLGDFGLLTIGKLKHFLPLLSSLNTRFDEINELHFLIYSLLIISFSGKPYLLNSFELITNLYTNGLSFDFK